MHEMCSDERLFLNVELRRNKEIRGDAVESCKKKYKNTTICGE